MSCPDLFTSLIGDEQIKVILLLKVSRDSDTKDVRHTRRCRPGLRYLATTFKTNWRLQSRVVPCGDHDLLFN